MPSLTALDRQRLLEALALAQQAIGRCDPNPRVGCVLGHDDGRVLGAGSTQAAGQAHAEVMALRAAAAAGQAVRGATAWVTLEPCSHQGRTPPCCVALIDAGVRRVVVAGSDPFPQVAGAGLARLRAAGIKVECAPPADPIAIAARELNIGFFSRHERGRPWVRMKIAASLDGRTALDNGASQWITGPAARADGQAWRRRAGAVLTGVGTVLADDPRLDVREVPTEQQPLRVVLDSSLRTPATARLLAAPGRALVLATRTDTHRRAALEAAGAEVLACPGPDDRVDLGAVIAELARRQVNELHVEAGAMLNAALLQADLVDELLVYLAPKLLGPGRAMATLAPLNRLDAAIEFAHFDTQMTGADLRLRLRRPARTG